MSKIVEGYARAVGSSHLRMRDTPGDVDRVIAAGWAKSLGPLLMRCRQEWDRERAALELAERQLQTTQRSAESERSLPAFYAADADFAASRVMIMMRLRSVRQAAEVLRLYTLQQSQHRGLRVEPTAIARIAAAALDVWLDQRCNACQGRGFNGGAGAPVKACKACRGTKRRRREMPSSSAEEHSLGEWAIVQIETFVAAAERKMHRKLR